MNDQKKRPYTSDGHHLGDDSGVAMVAAIAVAIIGMALCLVVLTQAIAVTNDSARDRVRTSEIHSAEGVLDATFYEMQTQFRCFEPTLSPMTVGEGTSAVEVTVAYKYFDEHGAALDASKCDSATGLMGGDPVGALVTATAVAVNPTASGIAPQRVIEAMVEFVPGELELDESAIFAGGTLTTNTSFTLTPVNTGDSASIRVNGSSWSCNTDSTITGNVVVINGSANLNARCNITGSIWAKGNIAANSNVLIGGNATSGDGSFTATPVMKVVGAVRAKGNASLLHGSTAASICSANTTPCAESALEPPDLIPLPEFNFEASDWTSKGFEIKSNVDFNTLWKNQSGATESWQLNNFTNPTTCPYQGWTTWWTSPKRLILNGGSSLKKDTVYDLRDCSSLNFADMTFVLYGDVAFIAKAAQFNTGVTFESGDGQPHNLYIMIPEGGTAGNGIAECSARGSYTPGAMNFNTQLSFLIPIQAILYTPCNLSVNASTKFRGQVYARDINLNSNNGFEFIPVPIPGDPLSATSSSTTDYSVQVLYKQERRN